MATKCIVIVDFVIFVKGCPTRIFSFSPIWDHPARLTGRSWSELDLDEYACSPAIKVTLDDVVYTEAEDAQLECMIQSSPAAQIDWHWKGRPIANMSLMSFGRQMYLIKDVLKLQPMTVYGDMMMTPEKVHCVDNECLAKRSEVISQLLQLVRLLFEFRFCLYFD